MAKIKAGTYRWNDVLTVPSGGFIEQSMVFTSVGDVSWAGVPNVSTADYNCIKIAYDVTNEDMWYTIASSVPDFSSLGIEYPTTQYAHGASGWANFLQTITIPTDSEVSADFATWFNANAKLQGGNAVTIEYNGNVIASFTHGTKAIRCNGAVMQGDVVVSVPEGMGGSVEEWDGSYTVTDAVELISFTIAGTTYQAEAGMTWYEWCISNYNTYGYSTGNESGMYVYHNIGAKNEYICTSASGGFNNCVVGTDVIDANGAYYHYIYSGGQGN